MKRLNYFKYQFLQEKDFKDEQLYHQEMRRKHNKGLHTWGRVYGLAIDFNPGEAKITIEPGMAIDREGREIIVDKNEPLDLTNYAGKAVYLVIAYKEQESDPSAQKEVTGNTRINESFQTDLFSPDNPPFGWDKSLKLILGKITLNPGPPKSDGAVNNIDYSEVTEAGVKVGEMKVPGVILTVEDHGPEEWPGIKGNEVSEPGTGLQGIKIDSKKTTLTGDLDISGDLTVKGTTTTVNTKTLEVTDNIITVNKYKSQQKPIEINGGLEIFRGGTVKNAQIIWDENEDKWKVGLEGSLIDIACSEKWKKKNWEQLTNTLSINDAGNVGIGETAPSSPLHIKSGADNILTLQTTDNAWLYTNWLDNTGKRRVWMGLTGDLSVFQIQPENGTKKVILGSDVEVTGSTGITGNCTVGYKGNGTLTLRHIDGKRWDNDNKEHLYLQHDTGFGVIINRPEKKGHLNVYGTIYGDYLSIRPQNTTNEGGEIRLEGTGGAGNIHIDNYQGHCRIHTLASNKQFQVLGGAAYITGNLGIGTATPGAKLDVNGFTRSLGLSVNNATNSGVDRGLWLWAPGDSNHVIYSANPSGKSPANNSAVKGYFDAGHRLRFRTYIGQGFLFENSKETALVDIDSDDGRLWTKGALYAGNSDIYFTNTGHNHTGIGNTAGYAAIENAKNYDALMILGRAGTSKGRCVKLWDYLEVNGELNVKGSLTGLNVADNFSSTVRCADFNIGHSSRRGSPGRALVDGTKSLYINYGSDWSGGVIYYVSISKASSRKLKKNIVDFSCKEAFQILDGLNPVKFNLKALKDDSKVHLGFIAEDVPNLISTDDNKGVNGDHIIAVLTRIAKEQQKCISVLSMKNEEHERKIDKLISSNTGKDFAEYFESIDGKEIKTGTSVILENGKVRQAKKGEIPIGIISSYPGLVGGAYREWPQKYLSDEFGKPVMEEYKEEIMIPKKEKIKRERQKMKKKKVEEDATRIEVVFENGRYCQKEIKEKVAREIEEPVVKEVDLYDAEGKNIIGKHTVPVTETYEEEIEIFDKDGQQVLVGSGKFAARQRPKLNPEYDKSLKYIPREERPEWNCVGLLGQLSLRKGQPVAPSWVKINDISDKVELWLIK